MSRGTFKCWLVRFCWVLTLSRLLRVCLSSEANSASSGSGRSEASSLYCTLRHEDGAAVCELILPAQVHNVDLCDGYICVHATRQAPPLQVEEETKIFQTAADQIELGNKLRIQIDQEKDHDTAVEMVSQAVEHYQHAIRIYNSIDNMENVLLRDASLAIALFYIGDIYSVSRDETQYAHALDFLRQAHDRFQKVLAATDHPTLLEDVTSIQLEYAQCCSRLGVILLDSSNLHMESDFLMQQQHSETWGDNLEEMELLLSEQMTTLFATAQRAQSYFESALQVYRSILLDTRNSLERSNLQRHIAATLQNKASALTTQGHLESAVECLEDALAMHHDNHKRLSQGTFEHEDTTTALGEALYSLADTYLQLGRYDDSQDRYQKAMDWYSKYELMPPANGVTVVQDNAEVDATLQEYERLWEEYNALFAGGVDMTRAAEELTEEEFYERDDGYEGDIHASLGILYMTKGDDLLAITHLQQAVQLYARIGEHQDRTMADTQFNLANVYFRRGEFASSAESHAKALKIYRAVVGEGQNPLTDGLPALDRDLTLREPRTVSTEENTDNDLNKPVHENFINIQGFLQSQQRQNSTKLEPKNQDKDKDAPKAAAAQRQEL